MTYREALRHGEQILVQAGICDAKNDAWLLLEMACKIDHNFYYLHIDEDMDEEQNLEFTSLIHKRAEHVPLQYITGEQEFMGHIFHVNSYVLIPRQDTETLVEEALKRVQPGMHVLDLCTGSGCVLVSILKNAAGLTGMGIDISKQAVLTAKENAKFNAVTAEFERSDLFENVSGQFDMIVSNPPYIPTGEIVKLMPEVAQFEPIEALDGKEDGLFFYRRILKECPSYLKEKGWLLLEIGCNQAMEVTAMMKQAGFEEVSVVQDLAHLDRVVLGHL